ncbi:DUF1801 domain-containing protein [Dyadobacter aurulentus]|uniref:DUF1801 domain-containing protein n=1 Tax=Dyadobacter sp. UC 10 TaxID=2605428 RepID=UPI0011F16AD1|nr:DUF1801 domain-containing protein [Dyadobacter sp. UC 10]KAA0992968.1 DUF1801 domain-containing protein [Dyadobacter sp. UC 10]
MKKENGLTAGVSEPEQVDTFMQNLQHPLAETAAYLREVILGTDPAVGEGIYWNTPTFYYTGPMQPFNPKEYKRYLVNFNFFKQDAIRLIFLRGADVANAGGLLEGDFKDGRRMAVFTGLDDVKAKEEFLRTILIELLQTAGQ